jgi:hypothetical protein
MKRASIRVVSTLRILAGPSFSGAAAIASRKLL